jgi:hypothetical protein
MKSMPKSKAKKQMQRLFQDGGMLQEGGTVDENSGNEVPVGSLKKEVRDDIPAQLSEGEFVFPADVVRFIGLERLMQMRQAAKNGLAKMDAMGQMGNADEATEEDTGEFETEIDDIIEEVENQSKKSEGGIAKFSAGGTVTKNIDPASVYQGYTKADLENALFDGQNKYDPAAAARVSEAYQFLGVLPEDINYWTTLLQHYNQDSKLYDRTPGSSQANALNISKQNLKQFFLAKDIAKGNLTFRQAGDILRAYDAEQEINSINARLKNEQSYLDAITKDPTKIHGGMDKDFAQQTVNTLLLNKQNAQSRVGPITESLKNVDVSNLEFTKAMTPTLFEFDSGIFNEATQTYDPSVDFSYYNNVPSWLGGDSINAATQQALKTVKSPSQGRGQSTTSATADTLQIQKDTTTQSKQQTGITPQQQQAGVTTQQTRQRASAFGGQTQAAVPSMAYQMRRFGKEGERDIYIPFMGDTPQLDIPEGFTQTNKILSKGGVYRDPSEAQPLLGSIRQPGQYGSASTVTGTVTQPPLVTMDPTYAGLDVDTDMNKYLLSLAEKDATTYAAEDKAKGRAWTRGTVLDNPFKDVKDLGTVSVQVGVDTDGIPIYEDRPASLTDWVLKQTDPASAKIAELVSHKTTDIQKLEQNGDVYYQISGKTGGADRERMTQVYKEIDDKLVPVGKATFYKGAHPDAAKVQGFAQVAGIFAAPFTAGLSTSIGSAIMGAGAVGAQTVGSAILGATFNGLTAAATGGNIGKAMVGGAAAGALNANAGEITSAIIGADNLNSIANSLNLKPAQVSNIFVGSIGSGVTTAIRGGDFGDVLGSFKDSLISSGVSEIAATNVMKSLSGTMDPNNLRRIGVATKMLSNVAINASMKGLDVNTAIKYYAPTVITKALTTPGGG